MIILNLFFLSCSSIIESFVHNHNIYSLELKNLKAFLSNFYYIVEEVNGFGLLDIKCKKYVTSLPNEICILRKMNILRFTNSNISQLPSSFVDLKEIVGLDFSSNNFKEIPTEIFSLLKLKYLDFNNNVLEHISNGIIKLESLEFLNVNSNQLKTITSCLYSLKSLKNLMFNRNKCRSVCYNKKWFHILKNIPQMEKLEILKIEGNLIEYISDNFFPPQLRVLKISHNMLKGLPTSLSKWSKLEKLDIIGNRFITFPSIILFISSLKILSLECVQIGEEFELGDGILPNLINLNLDIGKIDPLRPLIIKSDNIDNLLLIINKKKVLNLFRVILPRFEYFTLSNNSIELTATLGNAESLADDPYDMENICCNLNCLKVLSITIRSYKEEHIKIPSLKGLEGSEYLEEFRLSGVFLSKFPSEILNCRNLKNVNLSNNEISDIPDEINKLEKLEYLNMTNNNLSEINRRIFDIKTLKEGRFCVNNIKYLPKEYKMARDRIVLFDMYNLDHVVDGDDLGSFDLSEEYLEGLMLPSDFLDNHYDAFETYNFIETGYIRWNLEKVLSIKPDEIKEHQKDFEYLNNIWKTYLLPNIDNSDLLTVWEYIKTVYKVPGSTFVVENIGFASGIKRIKDYIENIFNILEQRVIIGEKDIVSAVFILMEGSIEMCFDGQLEAWRMAFLSLNNDYDENLAIQKFINDVLANIKENCLRKVTTYNYDFQNVHIFSYWKDVLHKKLGFTKSERAYGLFNESLEVYQSGVYILYRFFKEFRPEAVIKEILEIINENTEMVSNIAKRLFAKYQYDLSKIESFFEYEGNIKDRLIHEITFEGLLYILKEFELIEK